ncbi:MULTISPECIES: hypothetical protein [Bacteroides]|uniref:hypothetical protein n=1 Tax=Bacteroides TaxID=816 RepID=UPI001CB80711
MQDPYGLIALFGGDKPFTTKFDGFDKSYITYQDIIDGSTLKFVMGKKPNKNFGKAPASRPVVLNKIN